MWALVIFGLFCVVFHSSTGELSAEFKEKFMAKMEKVGEKCAAETGASQDDISKIITKEVPTTHEGKCMLFCGHREFHIQRADGSVDLDGAIASLNEIKTEDDDLYNKLVEVYTKCAKVPVVDDPCEYAVSLSNCGTHEADKLGVDASLLE